jgi:hypothetical protein
MVGQIKALLCRKFSRDIQRPARPIRIPLPALEARDEAVLVVWGVASEKGERKIWICAGRERAFDTLVLSLGGQHMHGVVFAQRCSRFPTHAAFGATPRMTSYG